MVLNLCNMFLEVKSRTWMFHLCNIIQKWSLHRCPLAFWKNLLKRLDWNNFDKFRKFHNSENWVSRYYMVLPSLNFNNKNHTWKWMAKEDFSAILFGWRTWPWCFGSAVQFVQRALGPSARLGVPKMGALPSTNWQAYHTIHRFYCRNLYYYIYIYIYIYIHSL